MATVRPESSSLSGVPGVDGAGRLGASDRGEPALAIEPGTNLESGRAVSGCRPASEGGGTAKPNVESEVRISMMSFDRGIRRGL